MSDFASFTYYTEVWSVDSVYGSEPTQCEFLSQQDNDYDYIHVFHLMQYPISKLAIGHDIGVETLSSGNYRNG
jgi:hypothetical protein